jgi:XTP/dITP diphosphohydrolase
VANALIKARHAAIHAALPAIADDSGLEVDALGGRPGIHTARYAGPVAGDAANNDKLLAELARVPAGRRSARYRCAMAFVRDADDPEPVIAEAAWEGFIGFERRGTGGFGYDPLFVVADGTRTAAEMPAIEKNRVSHRGQALRALAERMKKAGW